MSCQVMMTPTTLTRQNHNNFTGKSRFNEVKKPLAVSQLRGGAIAPTKQTQRKNERFTEVRRGSVKFPPPLPPPKGETCLKAYCLRPLTCQMSYSGVAI
jgi:hypothetical protein